MAAITAAVIGGGAALGSAGLSFAGSSQGGHAPGIRQISDKLWTQRGRYQQGWNAMNAQDALYNSALQSQLAGNQLFGSAAQNYSLPYQIRDHNGRLVTRYRNFSTGPQEGSLSQAARAQPYLQQQRRSDQMDQAGLTSDIYSQFGQGINQTTRAYDPQQTALSDQLLSEATQGLNMGGRSAYEDRYLAQDIRGAQAARGRGYGNADLYQEAVGLDRNRQDRRLKQQDFASRVLGQRNQMFNPASAQTLLFGRGGGATNETGLVNSAFGANQQAPSSFLQSLGVGGALQQNAYATNQSINNMNANSQVSALGGLGNAAFAASRYYGQQQQQPGGGGGGYNQDWYGGGGFY